MVDIASPSLTTTVRDHLRSRLTDHQLERLKKFQAMRLRWLQDFLWNALFGSNLNVLATIYNSDKWDSHWYTQHYQRHFASLRRKRLNVLEIGIGGYEDLERGGASLRMWRTFFRRANIYGIDLHDKRPHNERRIRTFKGSQIDEQFLAFVLKEIGKIDIIIDDGSHHNEHVLQTFQYLFPRLAETGIYVIEDTQTSYWPEYGGSNSDLNRTDTMMGYFKGLVDGINYRELNRQDYRPTYLDRHVVALHFYHNIVFIQKGQNQEESNML